MQWTKSYSFVYQIDELTSVQQNILSTMLQQSDGIGSECTIKFTKHLKHAKATLTKAKKEMIAKNILSKTKKAFTYKINEIEDWNIEVPNVILHKFDKIHKWLPFIDLPHKTKLIYSRLKASTKVGSCETRRKLTTLAEELGIEKQSVRRHIKKLVNVGLISIHHTKTEQS